MGTYNKNMKIWICIIMDMKIWICISGEVHAGSVLRFVIRS